MGPPHPRNASQRYFTSIPSDYDPETENPSGLSVGANFAIFLINVVDIAYVQTG